MMGVRHLRILAYGMLEYDARVEPRVGRMPREFRYKVTAFVDGVLTLDERVLRFKQGVRAVQVPLANIRRFGMKVRGKSLGGIVTSELVLLTEPSPGQSKIVRVALDPAAENGKAALAALGELLPAADTTKLPWDEAAKHLGVPAHSWQDGMMSRWGMIGLAILAGLAGVSIMHALAPGEVSASTRLGRGIAVLVGLVVAVVCLAVGVRSARPKTAPPKR
jgi:hypothetical protein